MPRTHTRFARLLAVLLLTATTPCAFASSLPIQVDGLFSDWGAAPFTATDPAGDGGGSGIDFTTLMIAHDEAWLYLRFRTGVEVQPDELHNIAFVIDSDRNTSTGAAIAGLGAELVWNLGQRTGTFYAPSGFTIGHADLGLVVGPTVSGTEFEIAIRRDAMPGGVGPLFPAASFTMALVNNVGGGDQLVVGMPGYAFDATPQPVPSVSLGRLSSAHVRIASYNVENDGLFAGGAREAAHGRMFDAINPDVWVFNEVWNGTAAGVASKLEQHLPSGAGQTWHTVKLDQGNVIASRFPILQSWNVLPGSRITAALLDPGPSQTTDLLVIANHWSCCAADQNRQNQADALIAFLRDARTPGGVIDLAPNTPIVAAGDFNLVGWKAQLVTLLTGDIVNNATYGPDAAPDWDGSEFDEALARHPDARFVYTWRDDLSSFYPGRLDYMLYTGSVSQVHHTYVLDTRSMTPSNLAAHGLEAMDTEIGSDHAPIVADFTLGAGVAGVPFGDPLAQVALAPPVPNPFADATTLRFRMGRPGAVRLTVHDVLGRLVYDTSLGERPAGTHVLQWNGRNQAGQRVRPGLYVFQIRSGRETARQRAVVIR